MTLFHVRQLARNSFFRQLTISSSLVYVALKVLAARASGAKPDPLTGFEAGIVGLWTLVTTATGIIGFQRFQGVLQYQVLSPRKPAAVFAPVVLAAVSLGLFSIPIGLGAAALAGVPLTVREPWLAIAAIIVVVLGCAESALAIAALMVLSTRARVYEQLMLTPVWLLTGIVISWGRLPPYLRPLSFLSPLTGGVQALRDSASGDGRTWAWLLASMASCLVWLALAQLGLGTAQRRARVTGTLDL